MPLYYVLFVILALGFTAKTSCGRFFSYEYCQAHRDCIAARLPGWWEWTGTLLGTGWILPETVGHNYAMRFTEDGQVLYFTDQQLTKSAQVEWVPCDGSLKDIRIPDPFGSQKIAEPHIWFSHEQDQMYWAEYGFDKFPMLYFVPRNPIVLKPSTWSLVKAMYSD